MASCITSKWVSTAPQMQLVVEGSSASNDTKAVLAWTLKYIAAYPAESVARPYKVIINGSTVADSTYAINGKTGTHTVASGTVEIARGTAAKSVPFSVEVDWSLTWSGVYCGKKTASSTISVAAKTAYTVSYNANGGSGAPSSQTKWHDTALELSDTKPTRTGYTFQGWATSAGGSVAYAAGASYTANAAVTLYAVWKANTFTVSFNANGGTGAPANQTKTYGVPLALSSTKPTRTNYNFLGWGTSASATTVAYAAGASYTENAAITLYAVWQLAYTKPRITELQVDRCDSSGASADDGAHAKVAFSWASDKTVSSVKIEWKKTTETTWPSDNVKTVSASGTSGNVSQIVGGSLSEDSTYDFRVTVADASGSTPTTVVLGGAKYAIDFLTGGNGVAVGKVAEQVGVFEVALTLKDKYNTLIGAGLAAYTGGGDSGIDPNTTLEELVLTSHTNAPQGLGTFYFIHTAFYNAKSATAARAQFAYPYNKQGHMYRRYYASGAWSAWTSCALDSYPVGSYYISGNSTSPASLFGGTWHRIESRFLWAAPSTSTLGATAGEMTHTLTVDELPSHTHQNSNNVIVYNGSSAQQLATSGSGTKVSVNTNVGVTDWATGGGAAHNNMPPYVTVAIWRREA